MARKLQLQTSDKKAEAVAELVKEGHFSSISDALDTALTLLLDRYGKLGVSQPRQPRPVEADTGAAEG